MSTLGARILTSLHFLFDGLDHVFPVGQPPHFKRLHDVDAVDQRPPWSILRPARGEEEGARQQPRLNIRRQLQPGELGIADVVADHEALALPLQPQAMFGQRLLEILARRLGTQRPRELFAEQPRAVPAPLRPVRRRAPPRRIGRWRVRFLGERVGLFAVEPVRGHMFEAMGFRQLPHDPFEAHEVMIGLPRPAAVGMHPVQKDVQMRILQETDEGIFVGPADALVLAASGLARVGEKARCERLYSFDEMLPAVGQGIVAVECRCDDYKTLETLSEIDDPDARRSATAERELLWILNGHCNSPIAAICTMDGSKLKLQASVMSIDGSTRLDTVEFGEPTLPRELGRKAAFSLLRRGAGDLIEDSRL